MRESAAGPTIRGNDMKGKISLLLPLLICVGLASLAAPRGANAFYKRLSAYNRQGFDVLYADLQDLDADGISEMIVVSSETADAYHSTAAVDIWQIKNGAAAKVTSAECNAAEVCSMGYYAYGGKTYILSFTFRMRWGNYSVGNTFITTGGLVERLSESGAVDGADQPDGFTYSYQGSTVPKRVYRQYAGAFLSADKLRGSPGVFAHPGADGVDIEIAPDTFISGDGQSWTLQEGNHASYQAVLDQLSAANQTRTR